MSNHVTMLSMLQTERGHLGCHLFAYSSKSLPCIEIVGMGKRGKILKEKIIFWLKKRKIRLPALKYVICLEVDHLHSLDSEESFRWLELPSVILLMTLAEILPLNFAQKCFCAGRLGLEGDWIYPDSTLNFSSVESFLNQYRDVLLVQGKGMKYLDENLNLNVVDFEEMLESL